MPAPVTGSLLASVSVLLAARSLAVRRDPKLRVALRSMTVRHALPRAPLRDLLAAAGRRSLARGGPVWDRLGRRLELSGSSRTLQEAAGVKNVAAGGAALLAVMLAVAMPTAMLLVPIGSVAAYRLPDLILARRGRRRQTAIQLRVPELVELLVATTEAGLAPAVALRRSSEVLGGPLGEELRLAVAEMDLGSSWRVAMDRMVERTEVASLGRLVAALARSNRLGTPVGVTLRSVAGDLRAERRARAEELARRAPVKMLFPLVFLILPAFLLLTVGPVVLATVRSLKSG